MASWRTEAVERLAEMSGTDVDGAILPPPAGAEINRQPMSWWRPTTAWVRFYKSEREMLEGRSNG